MPKQTQQVSGTTQSLQANFKFRSDSGTQSTTRDRRKEVEIRTVLFSTSSLQQVSLLVNQMAVVIIIGAGGSRRGTSTCLRHSVSGVYISAAPPIISQQAAPPYVIDTAHTRHASQPVLAQLIPLTTSIYFYKLNPSRMILRLMGPYVACPNCSIQFLQETTHGSNPIVYIYEIQEQTAVWQSVLHTQQLITNKLYNSY